MGKVARDGLDKSHSTVTIHWIHARAGPFLSHVMTGTIFVGLVCNTGKQSKGFFAIFFSLSSYMYYYTVNLSPSVIIRDAVIIWAVMQQTKRVTFMHTCPLIFFFVSFSKIFILAYYRDLKRTFRCPRSVIVGHCRSLQVIPCFSNYASLVAVSQCPETDGVLDMARGNVPAICVAFKRFLRCSDDRSLPLVEKICDSMGFRAAPAFEQTRSGPPAVFLCCLYFVL